MSPPLILEIQNGKFKGRKVKLAEGESIVGRGEESKIRISSSEVSREHCILIPQENGLLVRDLGSRNGTFINGRPLDGEAFLEPGGVLTVGPLAFQLLGPRIDRPTPKAAISPALRNTDDKLSDDDIASWLSDELPAASPTSDTAILSGPGAGAAPVDAPLNRPTPSREIPSPSGTLSATRRREFKTVEEEARDIIRRHYEMAGEAPPG